MLGTTCHSAELPRTILAAAGERGCHLRVPKGLPLPTTSVANYGTLSA